jgi:hypothetical protein
MIGDPRNGIVQALMQRQQQQQPGGMQGGPMQQPMQARMMGTPAPVNTPAASTGDFANAYNNAAGPQYAQPGAQQRGLGGNLGLSGATDPSMWNAGLPSGSLTGV